MAGRIRHLVFLAQNQLFEQVRSVLKSGRPGLWGTMPRQGFERFFHRIHLLLSHDPVLMEFVTLALVTEARCFKETTPAWLCPWIQENIDPDFSGTSVWRQMFLPLVTGQNTPGDFCMLAATFTPEKGIDPVPDWAIPLLDEKSRTAIQTAETAARTLVPQASGSLVVYPLLPPTGRVQITGASLGLPLALLFLSLLKDQPLHPGITATGRIDGHRQLHDTGGINEKLALAESRNLKLFLSTCVPGVTPPGTQIETAAVSTLDQAWFTATSFSAAGNSAIATIREMMGSGRAFAENLGRCDLDLLESAVKAALMDRALEELEQDRTAFKTFAGKLLAMDDLSQGQKTFLCALVNVDRITDNGLLGADAVVKFITFLIHTANTRGETVKCDALAARAMKCINHSSDIRPETRANFFNNQLVSCHNHYRFDPAPPALAFSNKLERAHQIKVEMGSPIDPVYGGFCGTLSQHFGFCGPQFIDAFCLWHKKALGCFGRGLDASGQYRTEWLRQYSYAVYALLDAGMDARAETMLCRYLETDRLAEIIDQADRLTCWHHAAIARFFADTDNRATARTYLDKIVPRVITAPAHPWQLWYCNCGRIARNNNEAEKAEALFMKSIKISMAATSGPAITVMALIPLYELFQTRGSTPVNDLESMEKSIRAAARRLNIDHFAPLENAPTLDALFQDKAFSIERMFPFSCR